MKSTLSILTTALTMLPNNRLKFQNMQRLKVVLPLKGGRMKKNILCFFIVCGFFLATASAAEFSGDMVSDMGVQTTTKIYNKAWDISRNEMDDIIVIRNGSHSYQLFPEKKLYVVTDLSEMKKQNPLIDVKDFEAYAKSNNWEKIGTEEVSGYKCKIYQGTLEMLAGTTQISMNMKIWYSSKLDYAVKTETEMAYMGTVVATLKNIKEGKQPDSLFEIPSGYTEAESIMEAMGYGDMTHSSETGSESDTATPEDMEKMMNMIQEMMGGD